MHIEVRTATIHDQEGINCIAVEVAGLHARAHPDRFRRVTESFSADQLRSCLESDQHQVLVAVRNGIIVGFERMVVRKSPGIPLLVPRRFVFIDELAVAAPERRQGVGRLLVAAAATWARERAASSLELNVWEFNEAAVAFYERLGFGTLSRSLSRPIDPEAGVAASE